MRARLKPENPVQLQVANQMIHGPLPVLAADLGKDQLGGIGVVKPACTTSNSFAFSRVMC